MAGQVVRKVELAENLSREREEEYRLNNSIVQEALPMTPAMEKRTRVAVNSFVFALSRGLLPQSSFVLSSRAGSLALTALVLGFSTLLAGSGAVGYVGETLGNLALESRSLAIDSIDRTAAYAIEKRRSLATSALEEIDARENLIAIKEVETLSDALTLGMHDVHAPVEVPLVAFMRAAEITREFPQAKSFDEVHSTALTILSNPIEAVDSIKNTSLQTYVSVGELALNDVQALQAFHVGIVENTAISVLSIGIATRDAGEHAPRTSVELGRTLSSAYGTSIQDYVEHVDDVPRAFVGTIYGIGDTILLSVSTGITLAPVAYETTTDSFVLGSINAADTFSDQSFAFGAGARTLVGGALAAQDRAIARYVYVLKDGITTAGRSLALVIGVVPSIAADKAFGMAGVTAHSAETGMASVGAASLSASALTALDFNTLIPAFLRNTGSLLAEAARTALHGILGPLAGFFNASDKIGLAVIPIDETFNPDAVTNVENTTIVYENTGPVTVVRNEYTTLTYTGVPQTYVDAQLLLLRERLLKSIENSNRASRSGGSSSSGGISSIDGLSGSGLTISNSTWDGGLISNAILNVLDTTITGDLLVDGKIEATDYIAGPYILATSTTATSAFSGNIAVGRNTSLGTSASDLLTINSSIGSNLLSSATNTYDIGSSTNVWRRGYFGEVIVNGLADGCVEVVAGQLTSIGSNCGTGGGGISSLNGLVASSQTFATTTDTNIGLSIVSSGSTHTFTSTWIGTLAAGRGGTGVSSVTANQLLIGGPGNTWSQIATSSLGLQAAGNYFLEGGNSFGTTATLGTNDTQALGIETDGVTRITVLPSGEVGIGNTPQGFFDVAGQTLIGDGNRTAQSSFPLYISDSSNLGWKVADSSGTSKFELYAGFGGTNEMRLLNGISLIGYGQDLVLGTDLASTAVTIGNANGYVGIGTTTPGFLLSVAGSAYIGGNLTATGTATIGTLNGLIKGTSGLLSVAIAGTDYVANATGDWTGTFDGQEGTYYLARANHTGTQLASTISDFATTARGLFSSTATGLTYTSGTGVFSLTSGYEIPLTASTTEWNSFYSIPSTRITAGSGLAWTGNTLNVSTSSLATGFFQQAGNSFGTTAILGTNDAQSLQFETNNAVAMTILSSGNVGIGTTTPDHLLTVNGTFGTHLGTNLNLDIVNGFMSGTGISIRAYNDAVNAFIPLEFNASRFYFGGGNVGIGTSTPTALLDVSGADAGSVITTFTPATTLAITNRATASGSFETLAFRSQDATFGSATSSAQIVGLNYFNAPNNNSGALSFMTLNTGTLTEKLRITSAGLIGIGSTSPYARLSVKGLGTTTDVNFQTTNSSDVPLFTILDSGNVGISTTSPYAKLSVAGDLALNNILPNGPYTGNMSAYDLGSTTKRFNAAWAGTYNVGTSTWSITTKTNGSLAFFDQANGAGTERLTINNNGSVNVPGTLMQGGAAITASQWTTSGSNIYYNTGNVGIGTSSPSARLAVAGTGTTTARAFAISDSANTERLTVLDNGNVGIGTSTPLAKLSIRGDGLSNLLSITTAVTVRTYTTGATWTKPANLARIEVRVFGGGGGGAGAVQGAAAGNGGNGATSTFTYNSGASSITATGGTGSSVASGGAGGSGSGGDTNTTGSAGTAGVSGTAGNGGNTEYGIGGGSSNGGGGNDFGAGGAGGPANAGTAGGGGGGGGQALKVILAAQLGATETVTIGGGGGGGGGSKTGTAGTNGTNGSANTGGAGGAGAGGTYAGGAAGTGTGTNVGGAGGNFAAGGAGTGLAGGGGGYGNPSGANTYGGAGGAGGKVVITEYYDSTVSAPSAFTITGDTNAVFSGLVSVNATNTPRYSFNAGNSTVSGIVARFTNSTGSCTIDPTNSSLSCSSDARLKKNVAQINTSDTLTKLSQLSPVFYNWNSEDDTESQHAGFLAQQLQAVLPDLVSTDDNGYLSVNYGGLTPYLAAGIQQLNERTSFLTSLFDTEVASTTSTSTAALMRLTATTNGIGIGTASTTHMLTVAGDAAFSGNVFGSAFIVPNAALEFLTGSTTALTTVAFELPLAVLTTDGLGADLYRMGAYALYQIQNLTERSNLIDTKLETIENRLVQLENATSTPGMATVTVGAIQDLLAGFEAVFEKGVAAFNTLVFRQLAVAEDENGFSSAGSISILAGNTVAEIENPYALPSSKIFITFTSAVSGTWYVSEKQEGKFHITLSEAQSSDISFDYFILQSEGQLASPQAAISPEPVVLPPPVENPPVVDEPTVPVPDEPAVPASEPALFEVLVVPEPESVVPEVPVEEPPVITPLPDVPAVIEPIM